MIEFFKNLALGDTPRILASVDLGSNSFHLLVVRVLENGLQVEDNLRELTRLGAGLDKNDYLSEESQQNALECLQRFSQRLRDIPTKNVRVVGTNALRIAVNANAFLEKAQQALGHPIKIIYGHEEARLIYLGVAHDFADQGIKRLVVDIGGGSTEIIVGENFEPLQLESLEMGCVTMSKRHFTDGKFTRSRFDEAEISARLELEGFEQQLSLTPWQQIVGSSGSIRSIAKIVMAQGWSTDGITKKSLKQLRKVLLEAGQIDNLSLKGLADERKATLAGGYIILQAVFNALSIDHMIVSGGSIRDGLIYEMLGVLKHDDIRERTLGQLMKRYSIDNLQAARVESAAMQFLTQVKSSWNLDDEEHAQVLSWSARLHEWGKTISHTGYHKHGAYLSLNSDLQGFSLSEQQLISVLIRSHRRKLSLANFDCLSKSLMLHAVNLCILLRLAVILHRSRLTTPLPEIKLKAKDKDILLTFPDNWLDSHALTLADLQRETDILKENGYNLTISQSLTAQL